MMTTEAGRLRRQVLRLGGRLEGFEHTLIEESSKPSDPTDIRWDCMCGYAGSPERVERHWDAMLAEYESGSDTTEPSELDKERLTESVHYMFGGEAPGGCEHDPIRMCAEYADGIAHEYHRLATKAAPPNDRQERLHAEMCFDAECPRCLSA